jgi:hypothetical protein
MSISGTDESFPDVYQDTLLGTILAFANRPLDIVQGHNSRKVANLLQPPVRSLPLLFLRLARLCS